MVQFSQTKRFLDFSIGDTAIVTESSLSEEVMLTDEDSQFCIPMEEAFHAFQLHKAHFCKFGSFPQFSLLANNVC